MVYNYSHYQIIFPRWEKTAIPVTKVHIHHCRYLGFIPGNESDLRERLMSNGGCGNKRRLSTTTSLMNLKRGAFFIITV